MNRMPAINGKGIHSILLEVIVDAFYAPVEQHICPRPFNKRGICRFTNASSHHTKCNPVHYCLLPEPLPDPEPEPLLVPDPEVPEVELLWDL